jgi:hypothetical protein
MHLEGDTNITLHSFKIFFSWIYCMMRPTNKIQWCLITRAVATAATTTTTTTTTTATTMPMVVLKKECGRLWTVFILLKISAEGGVNTRVLGKRTGIGKLHTSR